MLTTSKNDTEKYHVDIPPSLDKKLAKLKRRDVATYSALCKKIDQLRDNPHAHKPLRGPLKNQWRVHIGPFVLTYEIIESEKIIWLLDFDHHDNIYLNGK